MRNSWGSPEMPWHLEMRRISWLPYASMRCTGRSTDALASPGCLGIWRCPAPT
jgi:hypothetical protein